MAKQEPWKLEKDERDEALRRLRGYLHDQFGDEEWGDLAVTMLLDTFEEQVTAYATGDGGPRFSPFFIPRILADSSSGMIALEAANTTPKSPRPTMRPPAETFVPPTSAITPLSGRTSRSGIWRRKTTLRWCDTWPSGTGGSLG